MLSIFSQVGFDQGTSFYYYTVPWSLSSAVLNLAKTSNVGLTGRWMFRVDEGFVTPAGIVDESGIKSVIGAAVCVIFTFFFYIAC